MWLAVVLVLPLTIVAALLVAVLIAIPRRRSLVAINERDFPELARLRALTTVARIIGVAVGLIVVVSLVITLPFGLGVFLAPAVFAGTQILAAMISGVVTHGAARTTGTAGLEVRSVNPYLPLGLTVLTASATTLLALALAWTTAMGVPDDMGNLGRKFTYSYPCDGVCTAGFSPWPGSFYSIPVAVLLAIVLILAVVAVLVTVRRPRNASDPEIVRVDDFVRARSVESVVAAVGVAAAGTLLLVSIPVANGLSNPANDIPALLRIPGWGALIIGSAAFAMTVWSVVILLLPGATAPFQQTREDAEKAATVTL